MLPGHSVPHGPSTEPPLLEKRLSTVVVLSVFGRTHKPALVEFLSSLPEKREVVGYQADITGALTDAAWRWSTL